jgi:hypothetical protein
LAYQSSPTPSSIGQPETSCPPGAASRLVADRLAGRAPALAAAEVAALAPDRFVA